MHTLGNSRKRLYVARFSKLCRHTFFFSHETSVVGSEGNGGGGESGSGVFRKKINVGEE